MTLHVYKHTRANGQSAPGGVYCYDGHFTAWVRTSAPHGYILWVRSPGVGPRWLAVSRISPSRIVSFAQSLAHFDSETFPCCWESLHFLHFKWDVRNYYLLFYNCRFKSFLLPGYWSLFSDVLPYPYMMWLGTPLPHLRLELCGLRSERTSTHTGGRTTSCDFSSTASHLPLLVSAGIACTHTNAWKTYTDIKKRTQNTSKQHKGWHVNKCK